jgi:hypothetical protein
MDRLRLTMFLFVGLAGCSAKSGAVHEASVPKYDAEAIAKAALAEFDKDGNGAIDSSEARACPALLGAFAGFDANNDKKITADEIKKRVETYAAGPTGSVPATIIVRLDAKPLADATVTFIPEACMGSVLKTATARTNPEGICGEFQIDGKAYRGLPAGLYKIQVVKEGANVPARYNTQTTLGIEIFHDTRRGEVMIDLPLVSR